MDTGSGYTCRRRTADRSGYLVFAEPGDTVLLGAHSLEGLNLKVDPVRQMLVPPGPVIAAAAA